MEKQHCNNTIHYLYYVYSLEFICLHCEPVRKRDLCSAVAAEMMRVAGNEPNISMKVFPSECCCRGSIFQRTCSWSLTLLMKPFFTNSPGRNHIDYFFHQNVWANGNDESKLDLFTTN